MSEWVSCRLADSCESIDYGFTASANPAPVGPKFLRITDIVGGALRWEAVPHVKGDIRELERYRLAHEDVVIARTGATTGESYFIQNPPDAVFASYLVRLKIKRSVSPRFIAYWLKSPQFQNYLAGVLGDKSAQPNASASTMTNAPITLPADKAYQHAIASVLGALDDKIELNRQMNETLEAMARAIFKDWFVDFGPTRAKMEGRAPYLAPDIWPLFPDRLDDEGKPEGWVRKSVSALYNVSIGRTPPRKEHHHFVSSGQGQKWLSIRDMANLQAFAFTTSEELTAEAVSRFRVPIVRENTALLSFKLTVGRVAIAAERMCTNEAIANLVPNPGSGIGPYFTYSFLKSYDYHQIGSTSSIATAFNSDSVREMNLVFHHPDLIMAFEKFISPLFERIKNNGLENITLAATRDLLLPKLMSGEVRVKDAEKLIGEPI